MDASFWRAMASGFFTSAYSSVSVDVNFAIRPRRILVTENLLGLVPVGHKVMGVQVWAARGGAQASITSAIAVKSVQQGLVCGAASDGCGGSLQCGTCPGGTSCSAGQCVKGVKK